MFFVLQRISEYEVSEQGARRGIDAVCRPAWTSRVDLAKSAQRRVSHPGQITLWIFLASLAEPAQGASGRPSGTRRRICDANTRHKEQRGHVDGRGSRMWAIAPTVNVGSTPLPFLARGNRFAPKSIPPVGPMEERIGRSQVAVPCSRTKRGMVRRKKNSYSGGVNGFPSRTS